METTREIKRRSKKQPPVTIQCIRCKNYFSIDHSKSAGRKYCSQKCQWGTLEERFWDHVDVVYDLTSCWNWTACVNEHGYGIIGVGGKSVDRASRVSWRIHNGEIGGSKVFVCHHCDNPLCVRPDHLFLGSAQDNSKDCASKGRNSGFSKVYKGEEHGSSKLNEEKVRLIRSLKESGMRGSEIAPIIGVSRECVYHVINGKRWQHVK